MDLFNRRDITYLPQILALSRENLSRTIEGIIPKHQLSEFWKVFDILPVINVNYQLSPNEKFTPGQEVELSVNLNRISKIPTEGTFLQFLFYSQSEL